MRPNALQRIVALVTLTALAAVYLANPVVHIVEGTVLRARTDNATLQAVPDLRTLLVRVGFVLLGGMVLWFASAGTDDDAMRLMFGAVGKDGRRKGGLISRRPLLFLLTLLGTCALSPLLLSWARESGTSGTAVDLDIGSALFLSLLFTAMVMWTASRFVLWPFQRLRRHFVPNDADPLVSERTAADSR